MLADGAHDRGLELRIMAELSSWNGQVPIT